MYNKKQLMLDDILEKLKLAKEVFGNIPIIIDIKPNINRIETDKESTFKCTDVYKCTDILIDKNDVRIYNY